jgi:tetratricopeptide (TPR) repeat protein
MSEEELKETEVDAKTDFNKGKSLLKSGNTHGACRAFQKAFKKESENPEYLSYYGMCAALSRGEIKLGIELCTKAIKKEFYRPHYYENLSRVYVVAGNKKSAITAIMKGLKYDRDSETLHSMLVELGVREKPVISIFKRSNPLNKLLGIFFRRTIPQMTGKKGAGK